MKLAIKIILIIIVFSAGVGSGYYFNLKKNSQTKKSETSGVCAVPKEAELEAIAFDSESQKIRTGLKINLLQDYINFIFLPKEEVTDPTGYAKMMEGKVTAIKDAELTEKFYATGAENESEREKKILEFINTIVASIKKELE